MLFLSPFSSFTPDAGVNIHLFVKAEDLFSLSKAKKHPFSRDTMYISWMISNKVLSKLKKKSFFYAFQRGKKGEASQILRLLGRSGDPVGHILSWREFVQLHRSDGQSFRWDSSVALIALKFPVSLCGTVVLNTECSSKMEFMPLCIKAIQGNAWHKNKELSTARLLKSSTSSVNQFFQAYII